MKKPAFANAPAGEVWNRIQDPYISQIWHDTFVCSAGLKVPTERCLIFAVFPCCQLIGVNFMQLLRPRCWWRMEDLNPRAAHLCRAACGVTAPPHFPCLFSMFPGPSVRAVMRC